MKRLFLSSSLLLLLLSLSLAPVHARAQDIPGGGNLFTGKDAETVIASAIEKQGGDNDVHVFINEAREEDVLVNASGAISANTDGLEVDKAHNRWQVLLLLKADGRNLAPMRLTGRFDELTAIPVLKRRVLAGDVIQEADIDWDKQPTQHLRSNTVTDAQQLIGKSPKHGISQGRAIRQDEIASPSIVSKGAQVTLYYRTRNIEIKTFGEAMEPGARGDVIRVRNSTSKAIIQGVVESSNSVRVSSPETDSAEAM